MYPQGGMTGPPAGGAPNLNEKGQDPNSGVSEGIPVMPPSGPPGGQPSGAVDDFQARLDALKNL